MGDFLIAANGGNRSLIFLSRNLISVIEHFEKFLLRKMQIQTCDRLMTIKVAFGKLFTYVAFTAFIGNIESEG